VGVYNNFIIQKGATWNETVIWTDANGNPIDLSSYSAKLQISTDYETTPILTLSSPSSGIVKIDAEGKLVITATVTQTSTLATGYYVYELELTAGSTVNRIMEGELYVSPQVYPS
jgi:hypothetical protein